MNVLVVAVTSVIVQKYSGVLENRSALVIMVEAESPSVVWFLAWGNL
jgi:hypothetical protein